MPKSKRDKKGERRGFESRWAAPPRGCRLRWGLEGHRVGRRGVREELRRLSGNCDRASWPLAHRRGLEPGRVRGAETAGPRVPFQGFLGRKTAFEHPGCARSRVDPPFPLQPLSLSSLRSHHPGRGGTFPLGRFSPGSGPFACSCFCVACLCLDLHVVWSVSVVSS